MGDINVFTGPMKCGKSHVILQEAKRQMTAGKTIQIFKPGIDTRFSKDYVQDRNGNKLKAVNIDNIDELKDYDADVYIIDEFQFLNGDVKVIEDLAQEGKKFYIAGLNLTAEKKPFGKMGDLLCVSDHVKQRHLFVIFVKEIMLFLAFTKVIQNLVILKLEILIIYQFVENAIMKWYKNIEKINK